MKATLLLVLARRPKLLVLDEPTTGLDPVARHEILRELTAVMADEGRSILFSSHNTQDVEQISDQITFIDRGRIIDSMDKEMYLDRWRRLRLEVPVGIELPALPGIIGVQAGGPAGGRDGERVRSRSCQCLREHRRAGSAHRDHDAGRNFRRQRRTQPRGGGGMTRFSGRTFDPERLAAPAGR